MRDLEIERRQKSKVCHLTTVHGRYDTRIFIKECRSLARNGYEVHLIVADGMGDEIKDDVEIHDIGRPASRLKRMLFSSRKLFRKAISIEADIYHFHDPELLFMGKKLMKFGKKVVYDVHEDVPRQILNKAYIHKIYRKLISSVVERYENKRASNFSGIVTATPLIRDRLLKTNKNTIEVQNFPLIQEFVSDSTFIESEKENAVCYVGAISEVRGILNMVNAMQYNNGAKLLLGGNFESDELREKAINSKGWGDVSELGFLDRDKVRQTLSRSIAGLVVLEPTISYLDSIPVKMFEYMVAGIAVIASDFKYWRELIENENCALFVDPLNPKEISKAIQKLINNKKLANEMGLRGRKAVLERFNWGNEEEKLLRLYKKILK